METTVTFSPGLKPSRKYRQDRPYSPPPVEEQNGQHQEHDQTSAPQSRSDDDNHDNLLDSDGRCANNNTSAETNASGEGLKSAEQESLGGFVVDDLYLIGDLIRRDNHADVYAATCIRPDRRDAILRHGPALEARVYDFRGLSAKATHYRRRNMKRFKQQMCHCQQAELNGRTLLLYWANGQTTASHEAADTFADADTSNEQMWQSTTSPLVIKAGQGEYQTQVAPTACTP